MKQPACENIELQKHPWVRGCVNGAFSAGTDPGPVLLTDGQQMAFCVRLAGGEEEEKGRDRGPMVAGGDPKVFFWMRTLHSRALICRSEMPYHTTCLTFAPLTQ